MNKLFRALKAEQRKLWSKNSAVFCIVAVFVLAFGSTLLCASMTLAGEGALIGVFDNHHARAAIEQYDGQNWRAELTAAVSDADARLDIIAQELPSAEGAKAALLKTEKNQLIHERAVNEYRLENNVSPIGMQGWNMSIFCLWLVMPAAAVMSAVLASDMFAGEFSRGTARMMISRPVTRMKQYIAKHITAAVYAAGLMLMAYLGIRLACSVLMGSAQGNYVGYRAGNIYTSTGGEHAFAALLCCTGTVLCANALCAAVGCVSRSRAASAAAAIALVAAGVYLPSLTALFNSGVAGYTIIGSLDMSIPLVGAAWNNACGFISCVLSTAVHTAAFMIIGYTGFKKDI